MNAPLTPAEAKSLIISPTATFCQAFVKLFLQLPVLFWKDVNFRYRSDGSIANDFLRQIYNPGDLKFSASTLSQTEDWLLCNGAEVSREDYADLFAAINTVYGIGNGTTTFNLPDFRGRFPIGIGTTTGLLDNDGNTIGGTTFALGNKDGEERVVLVEDELAEHDHMMFIDATEGTSTDLTADKHVMARGHYATERSYTMTQNHDADNAANATVGPTANAGASESHNNLPPYLCVNVFVKT